MNKKTKTTFSIEGDYISDISRQKMLEGNWRGALKLLECVNELTLDDQVAILKGDKYLTGTNNLRLIEDNRNETIEFRKELASQYGKIISHNHKYYTPYALVNSWSKEDISDSSLYDTNSYEFTQKFDSEVFEAIKKDSSPDIQGHPYARSLHYADSSKDLAIGIFSNPKTHPYKKQLHSYFNSVILFQEIEDDIPFFLDKLLAQNPIECLLNKPRLDIRGAAITYPDSDDIYTSDESEPDIAFNDLSFPSIEDEDYHEKKQQYLEKLKQTICDFADNDMEYGWKTLVDEEGRTFKVPGRAFLHYSIGHCLNIDDFHRDGIKPKIPDYTPFSPSGLKTRSDNSFHTDCWIGAGMDIDNAYDRDLWQYKLIMQATGDFQRNFLDYDFHLLTRGGLEKISGTTCNHLNYQDVPEGQRILVIPHLGVEFEQAALNCDAIICEQGGPMAHLVIVSKECKKHYPIVRLDNACVKFCLNLPVTIDLFNGKINEQEKKKKPKY